MKLRFHSHEAASLSTELAVAIAILAVGLLPVAFSSQGEQRELARQYRQALAGEIIDGELEVLAAGEWRQLPAGSRPYAVKTAAAKNLPKGEFLLTMEGRTIRLAWLPAARGEGSPVFREVKLP